MVAALADDAHAAEQRAAVRRPPATALRAGADRRPARGSSTPRRGLYLWVTRDEDCWATVGLVRRRGILVAPGDFYGAAGARHVRVALTATDERVDRRGRPVGRVTTAAPGAPRRRSASAPPVLRVPEADLSALVARARRLLAQGRRRLLGLAGAPGVGEVDCGGAAGRGLGGRGGAGADGRIPPGRRRSCTGSAAMPARAPRTPSTPPVTSRCCAGCGTPPRTTVYAPRFDRGLEEPIAGAIPVPPELPLVVTEGNYLLVPAAPGRGAALLDEVWYCDAGRAGRLDRSDRPARRHGRSRARRPPGPGQRPAQRRADRHHPPPRRPDRPAHLRPGGGGGAGVSCACRSGFSSIPVPDAGGPPARR